MGEDKPTLWGGIVNGAKKTLVEKAITIAEPKIDPFIESDAGQEVIEKYAAEKTGEFFEHVQEDLEPITKSFSEALNPENKTTWELLTEKLIGAKKGLKRLLGYAGAAFLWIGAKVGVFFSTQELEKSKLWQAKGEDDEAKSLSRYNLSMNLENIIIGLFWGNKAAKAAAKNKMTAAWGSLVPAPVQVAA
jgi:hypothetical protein